MLASISGALHKDLDILTAPISLRSFKGQKPFLLNLSNRLYITHYQFRTPLQSIQPSIPIRLTIPLYDRYHQRISKRHITTFQSVQRPSNPTKSLDYDTFINGLTPRTNNIRNEHNASSDSAPPYWQATLAALDDYTHSVTYSDISASVDIIAPEVPRDTEIDQTIIDAPDELEIWTDGSLMPTSGEMGSSAVISYQITPGQYHTIAEVMGKPTSNGPCPPSSTQAELYAILLALKAVPIDKKITIKTDSQVSIHQIENLLRPLTTDRQRFKMSNNALLQAIITRHKQFNYPPKYVKVKAHSGIILNERADALALQARHDQMAQPLYFDPNTPNPHELTYLYSDNSIITEYPT
jgi:ribonuclease HI